MLLCKNKIKKLFQHNKQTHTKKMKISFKQEYEYLIPANQAAFREDLKKLYNWTTPQAFYYFISGKRKLTQVETEFVRSRLIYYFELQQKAGQIFLQSYIDTEKL